MDKSGKRNRFLDALAGRNVQEEPEKFPEIPLKDMVQTLEGVTEEAWGRYAFAREPLERKFTSQEKDAYTVKANACGREWAKRISEKYGTEDPKILAGKMGMKVKMPKVPTGGGVVLFAQYVQPDEITIFTDCVDKAAALEKQCGCPLLKKERLLEILLAHELFHAVEEPVEKTILQPFCDLMPVRNCGNGICQTTFRAECFSVYAGRTACIFL